MDPFALRTPGRLPYFPAVITMMPWAGGQDEKRKKEISIK